MVTITIPKKITQGKELIIVPKKDWEKLLKIAKVRISQMKIEKGLEFSLREIEAGKVIGPFAKSGDLIKNLER